jgi:hypothetical protein
MPDGYAATRAARNDGIRQEVAAGVSRRKRA